MAAIVQEISGTTFVLGIDVGGTGSRAALEPLSRPLTNTRRLLDGPAVQVSPDGSDALNVAADLVARARREWPDAPLAGVGVGATGLASLVTSPATALLPIVIAAGGAPVAVAIDAMTAHLGALGGEAGA